MQHTTKLCPLIYVCDAVARDMVQNFKQYNGAYGCGFCLQRGEVVPRGHGYARVYSLENDMAPLRTKQQTIHYAERVCVQGNGQSEMGVKGVSPLLLLSEFDIIKGFVPDYMHSVCLGVVRQFTNLWFDTKNANQDFHLTSRDKQLIDAQLLKLRPPS
ncbi:UNVERIFIED_CONTAM: hypothetical protein FKN15_003413 [Acipenser sinensis]